MGQRGRMTPCLRGSELITLRSGVDPQVYCGERSGSKEERQPAKRRLTVSVALRLLTLHLTKKNKKKKRGIKTFPIWSCSSLRNKDRDEENQVGGEKRRRDESSRSPFFISTSNHQVGGREEIMASVQTHREALHTHTHTHRDVFEYIQSFFF